MEGTCPLTTRQIVDEYFIENRTRILDIAAYLDRLERSSDGDPASKDFRMDAFRRALLALSAEGNGKIEQVQLIFSDPTTEPKEKLDTKSASGAWNPAANV
ncbi:MAG TPA: hypothetical protein VN982_00255 [Candidatus Dormibacteraeota bacterium]|jgi:hypothetical protein|nr:hypothetical protein [Candidatus Dormibacteraeota bacterium]